MNSSSWHFPGFSPELADFLVAERTTAGIGTDTATPDGARTVPTLYIHLTVTKHNIFILEYVKGTCDIPKGGATLLMFPMKIAHGSGAPTRIVATWGDDVDDHVTCSGARLESGILVMIGVVLTVVVGVGKAMVV